MPDGKPKAFRSWDKGRILALFSLQSGFQGRVAAPQRVVFYKHVVCENGGRVGTPRKIIES